MQRDLARLAAKPFDLLIIGGGVNGLATAWDASLRGFRVALVEKGDFGGATSANSLKIIHGGLRYLQHLDFRRMQESIRERSTLMRIAPHLIHPVGFLVPAYGHGTNGAPALAAACRINDFMSRDRNLRLGECGLHIPDGEMLSKSECLERMPGLDPDGLTGGLIFYDGQMRNADRLTLSFGIGAAAEGAALANYAEAISLLRKGSVVIGAVVRDREGDGEFDVRARLTINMAGPWSGLVARGLGDGRNGQLDAPLSKGFQIVTRHLTGDIGLAVASRHRDPNAVLSRGARHYFITPWRGHSLIGTTDTLYEGDPDDFRITESDVSDFVNEINGALPSAGLSRDDVRWAFGGLQPIDPRRTGKGAQVAKSPRFLDHAPTTGIFTVIGVKYTGCRLLAQQAVDRACEVLDHSGPECRTHETPLWGADVGQVTAFYGRVAASAPPGVQAFAMASLAVSYGSRHERVLSLVRNDPGMAETVPGAERILRAAIVHAVRKECALRLADVVMRRTDLGTLGHPGAAALWFCAETMARELDWGNERMEAEIAETEAIFALGERSDAGARG